ncbi:hypothetical protein [Saccharothrix sp. HUAS TT1]|uniref:hypothetical protein n=1 Tax=unclassified Saccharothrix TaxID=2593673 RepID=UPI00345BB6D9
MTEPTPRPDLPQHALPDPAVDATDARQLARDLVVVPDGGLPLVPDIGVIGGTHSVLVVET